MSRVVTNLMLDSGAYSAWNIGAKISVVDYAEYILANIEYIDLVVNLDVIPGARNGPVPSAVDIERAAQQSWNNFEYLRDCGFNVLPVFHQGERFYWLDRMLDEGCTYIGLGALSETPNRQRTIWLDDAWDRLADEDGRAKFKVHGFGVTSSDVMFRYPWYSIDSTTWNITAAYGMVMVPSVDAKGDWVFHKRIPRVRISREAPIVPGHYKLLGATAQAVVRRFIEEAGTTYEECVESGPARKMVNVYFYKLLSSREMDIRYKRQRLPIFTR